MVGPPKLSMVVGLAHPNGRESLMMLVMIMFLLPNAHVV